MIRNRHREFAHVVLVVGFEQLAAVAGMITNANTAADNDPQRHSALSFGAFIRVLLEVPAIPR
jgi:hypothetical protein